MKYAAWPDIDALSRGNLSPDTPAEGSYGLNEFAMYLTAADLAKCGLSPDEGHTLEYYWGTPNVKGAAYIPMVADCMWAGGFPYTDNTPPATENDISLGGNEIRRFCIDRHNGGYINMAFDDGHVQRSALKQLWSWKWSKQWADQLPLTPNWSTEAPWMVRLPEKFD